MPRYLIWDIVIGKTTNSSKRSVYQLAKQINLAQVLGRWRIWPGQIGFEGSLEGWERLLQQRGPES